MIAASHKTKLSPPALAKAWGIDVAKVLTWIKRGELKAINAATDRNGRPRYLIDQTDVQVFELSRTIQAPAQRVRRRRTDPNIIAFF